MQLVNPSLNAVLVAVLPVKKWLKIPRQKGQSAILLPSVKVVTGLNNLILTTVS